MRAPPDGYTLLQVVAANASNATLDQNLSFDFVRDIKPVASFSRGAFVMVVNPSFPAKNRARVYRLCQGQSGEDQRWRRAASASPPIFSVSCSSNDRD